MTTAEITTMQEEIRELARRLRRTLDATYAELRAL